MSIALKQHSNHIRFQEIDILRFLAAIAVMFYHYKYITPIQEILKYGYLGVDLFFLISGFVILMSGWDKTSAEFVQSRFIRLYPAFWICCIIIYLVGKIGGNTHVNFKDFFINLTMFQEFINVESISGVFWTLTIELKFYLLIFSLILFRQIHLIKYYCGLWLIISLLLSFHPIQTLDNVFMYHYAPYFIAGCTFFLIHKEGLDLYKTCLIVGSFVAVLSSGFGSSFNHDEQLANFNFLYISIVILSFYLIFFFITLNKTNSFKHPLIMILGKITYPLYLIHESLGLIFINKNVSTMNHQLLLVITIALMLFLAYLINTRIEEPFAKSLRILLKGKV